MEVSPHAVLWKAPSEDAATALVGSVVHAQGFAALLNPDRQRVRPWASADLDRWRPDILKALKGGTLTFEEIKRGIGLGWFQTWTLGEAIMITEAILSPRMRALHVFVSAGDLEEIKELTPAVEEFARLAGCTVTGATGRKGWARVLERFGYRPGCLHTVEKVL